MIFFFFKDAQSWNKSLFCPHGDSWHGVGSPLHRCVSTGRSIVTVGDVWLRDLISVVAQAAFL